MPDFDDIPAPPSPETVTQVAAIIRTILAGLGGAGVATGLTFSDAQLTAISAAVLTLGSLLLWAGVGAWSLWQKWQARKADHAGSVASAVASAKASVEAGAPVAVVVPPPSAQVP